MNKNEMLDRQLNMLEDMTVPERSDNHWQSGKMAERIEYPEHILEMIDLVSAILRRIKEKQLDKPNIPCLHMAR